MKKSILLIAFLFGALTMSAQNENHPPKFDPAKFDADLEQFITTEAGLSPQEASAFFPLYREMLRKQRVFFDAMRRDRHQDPTDDKACREFIEKRDKMDVEIKEIQQTYHSKFMKVLSPSKVFKIIQAEERFHRKAFKKMSKPRPEKRQP
ncbi:MAG: hypothetical protein IJ605_01655 [Prevotella sp.]|nr:hypothetical protein [Prevotella sp.]